MFCWKLQGMTTEVLFGPRAISQPLTHPVSMQARHTETALFDATNSSSLAQTPRQFFTLLSTLLLMPPAIFIFLISPPPPLLLRTRFSIDFLPTPPVASSVLQFFFRPNPFFSATPTRFFSWLPPPPLAYSTFQSLMTFNNHLYEPGALCRKAGSREAAAQQQSHGHTEGFC